jgi:hypothetical protein
MNVGDKVKKKAEVVTPLDTYGIMQSGKNFTVAKSEYYRSRR